MASGQANCLAAALSRQRETVSASLALVNFIVCVWLDGLDQSIWKLLSHCNSLKTADKIDLPCNLATKGQGVKASRNIDRELSAELNLEANLCLYPVYVGFNSRKPVIEA